jgi:hypothetical protein
MNGSSSTTETLRKSPSIAALAKALVQAMGELENPPKDEYNPHFKSRFCSLAGARNAIQPVFARHGLAVFQSLGSGERGPRVVTIILHSSGEWLESEALELPAQKQDAQGYGSAATYARRYSLLAAAGVVGDDDDDGQQATRQPPSQQHRPAAEPPKKNGQKSSPPAKGVMERRARQYESEFVEAGLCQGGEFMSYARQKLGSDPDAWAAEKAKACVAEFKAEREKALAAEREAAADAAAAEEVFGK